MSEEQVHDPVPPAAPEPPAPDAPAPKKLFRVIYKFLLLSLAAHVVGLVIFGGVIIMKKLMPEEVTFEAAPPMVRVEPEKRQYKLRVQQQKKRSSRPVLQQRLQSTRMSDLALPDLKTAIAPIKSKAAKIPGLTEGFGDGMGFGGGTGVGDVFGVKIQAEHLGVLLDVSFSTHGTIHLAIKEIQKSFPMAVIVLVPGCGMKSSQGNGQPMTAQEFEQKQSSLKTRSSYDLEKFMFSGSGKFTGLMKRNPEFKDLFHKNKGSGFLYALYLPPKDKSALAFGTQAGFDFLINDGVDAIFWFADFMDVIEEPIADRLISDLKKNNIKVYQQVLDNPDREPESSYFDFARKTGGKVIKMK